VSANAIYLATIWAIPLIIAITFHEAAHGFVAYLLGDDTAWRLGRVSFNPLKHVDPFGTILLPGVLLLLHSPFLFGYTLLCLRVAAECRKIAEDVPTPELRAHFLNMAGMWTELSDQPPWRH
jgi:Zn-dependent protease